MTQAYLTHINDTLADIEAEGMMKRERMITSPQAGKITVGDKGVINLCANNYLGLADHPELIKAATDAYTWAISNGIAKEQARAVLPEGNTLSRLYVNGTLRSWIHYIELRGANGTQKEHMDIAHAVADVIANIFPLAEEFKDKEI